MQGKKRKLISLQMVIFELRCVVGNPYVHIFGVGLPTVLALLITKVAASEMTGSGITGAAEISMIATSLYLGMGTLIPMAVILMGYAVSYAEELSKGIPQRMQLFGIKRSVSFCSRAVAELLFIFVSFFIFFASGCIFSEIEKPQLPGAVSYAVCMAVFSVICLALAHGIACICRNFGKTYCVSMMLYFSFMILGGMMGISYENLPKWAQAVAKLLPVMYINRDFYKIWTGEEYNCMPMIQSFFFLAAVSGILLFIALKRPVKVRKI